MSDEPPACFRADDGTSHHERARFPRAIRPQGEIGDCMERDDCSYFTLLDRARTSGGIVMPRDPATFTFELRMYLSGD